jgi:AAA domain
MITHRSTTPGNVLPFEFLSVEQLYDTPDQKVDYVVSNLLPTGGLSILAGKPKAGKSTLARQLAVAVAQGEDFLDRKTERGLVLYMALEEKLSEIKSHFKALGLVTGENLMTYCAPAMTNQIPRLDAVLKSEPNAKLIIIDPVFKFIKVGDSNDYVKVSDAFEPLLTMARDYDVHIMTVHHMKKRLAEDAMDSTLGSTALAAAVDTFIGLLQDSSGVRTLCSRQRYGGDMEKTQLDWDADNRCLRLGLTSNEADRQKGLEIDQRIESDMRRYVGEHAGCTQEAILDGVIGNGSKKKRVMRDLLDRHELVRQGSGAKGDPYTLTVQTLMEA